MKGLLFLGLIVLVLQGLVGQVSSQSSEAPAPTPTNTTTSTTTTPSTTTSSTSTTASPPTSSTTASPTSSTTASPTSSTTAAPTSSTTAAPSTTPKPKPTPKLNTYAVKDKVKDNICLLANLTLSFDITYNSTKTEKNTTVTVDVTDNAKVDENASKCGNDTEVLAITFGEGSSVTFTLTRNSSIFVSAISAKISKKDIAEVTDDAPESNVEDGRSDLHQYPVSANQFYSCPRENKISLGAEIITVNVINIKMEAFATNRTKPEFLGSENKCASPDIPDILPIAVGCALGVLIIVVLVAYVIGRRRNQQRGYQSM